VSLSTHVLDATTGRPATGLTVVLATVVLAEAAAGWATVTSGVTDADGRLGLGSVGTGQYRLTFETGPWFTARGMASFYPEVAITFQVSSADQHYHVPLLLSPFAYSTYRGS
jgi:5-hydroxyisourate hydrolase